MPFSCGVAILLLPTRATCSESSRSAQEVRMVLQPGGMGFLVMGEFKKNRSVKFKVLEPIVSHR